MGDAKTAVGAGDAADTPLYVFLLEHAVRELDRVLSEEGPSVDPDHPEDHRIDPEVASLVGRLRVVNDG